MAQDRQFRMNPTFFLTRMFYPTVQHKLWFSLCSQLWSNIQGFKKNIFFDLEVQILNFSDENETRVLYQYLAEGSVVFPKVFPVM